MDRFLTYLSRLEAIHILGLMFIAYAGVGSHDLLSAVYLLTLAGMFLLGYHKRDLDRIVFWIMIFLLINIPVALFIPDIPHGIFGNPNYLGPAMLIGIALSIAYLRQEFILPFLIGLYHSQSRGAAFAAGVVLLLTLWKYSRPLAITCLGLAIGAMLWFSGTGRESAFLARMGIWQDTLNHLSLWGAGFGSFFDAYHTWPTHINMTMIRAPHAYNDFLELIFELGIGVIPLWLLIILSFEGTDHRPRPILWAYFALSLTYFPLYLWGVGHISAMALGHLAASRQPQGKLKWLAGS